MTALAQYAGGRDWHWFRYPFLWEGDTLDKRHAVRAYLKDHGYRVAQVSLSRPLLAWPERAEVHWVGRRSGGKNRASETL